MQNTRQQSTIPTRIILGWSFKKLNRPSNTAMMTCLQIKQQIKVELEEQKFTKHRYIYKFYNQPKETPNLSSTDLKCKIKCRKECLLLATYNTANNSMGSTGRVYSKNSKKQNRSSLVVTPNIIFMIRYIFLSTLKMQQR